MVLKSLCFLCSILVFCHAAFGSPLPEISADGAILIEANTNTILYSKNSHEQFYPASTTKVLTSLLIAQDLPLDQVVTKTQDSINTVPSDSSQIGLKVGDSYTVLDGLYAVLMASDNFVSHDLAIVDSGSLHVFANKMNMFAMSIGASHSNFVNPHGYHDNAHYTTPYDLSQITNAAFNHPIIKSIAGTYQYPFTVLNSGQVISLTHTAPLLNPESPYYNPHVVAAKTGYHTPAGRTLVARAEYDNINLVAVVMRTETPHQFEDINTLFEYGSENFSLSSSEDSNEIFVVNETYSPWAKEYIELAFEKKWITHTVRNYMAPVTTREFATLIKSSRTCQYNPTPDHMIVYNGNSIYLENLPTTRSQVAQMIYYYLSELDLIQIPQELIISDIDTLSPATQNAIDFVVKADLMALSANNEFIPDGPVTYEEALCIISKLDDIVVRYHSFNLPGEGFLADTW